MIDLRRIAMNNRDPHPLLFMYCKCNVIEINKYTNVIADNRRLFNHVLEAFY